MAMINLSIEGEFLKRVQSLCERRAHKATDSQIAYEALNIGLNALESTLDELESGQAINVTIPLQDPPA